MLLLFYEEKVWNILPEKTKSKERVKKERMRYKKYGEKTLEFVDINEKKRYNEQQQQDAPTLLLCIFHMSL